MLTSERLQTYDKGPESVADGPASVASLEKNGTLASTSLSVDPSFDDGPDGGLEAWLVVISCFILNFNTLGYTYAFGVYQAYYSLHQFKNDSIELIALIGSSCATLTLITGIPVSRWMNSYGFRKVVFVGSVLFSAGLVAAGFCHTVPTLLVTQGIITGVGAGLLFLPGNTVPAQWFSKRRSLSIAIPSAGVGIGGIFWSFFTRAMISKIGYNWTLCLSGGIAAITNGIAVILVKPRPAAAKQPSVSFWAGMRMLKNMKFLTLYCAGGICVLGYMIPYFYISTYAQTQLNATPFVGSILVAVSNLGLTIGRVSLGFVADSKIGPLNTVIVAMALAGISQFALWLPSSKSLPLLYVFAFTYGFFGGGYIGLLPAVLVRIFEPHLLPSITGALYTSELPGQLASGSIAGALLSSSGGRWEPVILYSGITLLSGLLFAIITRLLVNRRIFATI